LTGIGYYKNIEACYYQDHSKNDRFKNAFWRKAVIIFWIIITLKKSGDMVAKANSRITSLGILGPFFKIA